MFIVEGLRKPACFKGDEVGQAQQRSRKSKCVLFKDDCLPGLQILQLSQSMGEGTSRRPMRRND